VSHYLRGGPRIIDATSYGSGARVSEGTTRPVQEPTRRRHEAGSFPAERSMRYRASSSARLSAHSRARILLHAPLRLAHRGARWSPPTRAREGRLRKGRRRSSRLEVHALGGATTPPTDVARMYRAAPHGFPAPPYRASADAPSHRRIVRAALAGLLRVALRNATDFGAGLLPVLAGG
jgi:hypothetical protein